MIDFWGFGLFGEEEVFNIFFDSLSVVKMKNVDNDGTMKKLQKTWDCVGGRFHDFIKSFS